MMKKIKNRNDLFDSLKISRKFMTYLLYKKGTENLYHSFTIPKKNGDVRVINAPNNELKKVQKNLIIFFIKRLEELEEISGKKKSNISHAFEKGKSIITNAKIHKNKKIILNIDLEDFFSSFHFGRVKGFFEKDKKFKFPEEVALIIAQLTCYQKVLPQGAPSSPMITNLICNIMDCRILKLSKRFKLNYSRYADDLTFSTNDKSFLDNKELFLEKLEQVINRSGFNINHTKTRLSLSNSRQEVTGLIVNKKINVPREYYKNTKAMAHSLYKKNKFLIDGVEGNLNQLEGRFAFINQIDKWQKKIDINNIQSKKFNSRQKEYQKFLFYKYFYGNEQPTILVEGPSDVMYIKAALKKLYSKYPQLVEKQDNNTFKFKLFFLRPKTSNSNSKKSTKESLLYLNDGGDNRSNLYSFFCNYQINNTQCNYSNYYEYFMTFMNSQPKKPIIFIFDNELNDRNKPVCKFIDHIVNVDQELISNDKKILNEIIVQIKDKTVGYTKSELEDEIKDRLKRYLYLIFYNKQEVDNSIVKIMDILANFIKKDQSKRDIKKELKDCIKKELKNHIKKELKERNKYLIKANMYIVVLPNKTRENIDIAIEDLLDEEAKRKKIRNKEYCELNKDDKVERAKMVLKEYKNFNFEKFESLLDNLNNIIEEYDKKFYEMVL